MSALPEDARRMMEDGIKQTLEGKLTPQSKAIIGSMGIDLDAMVNTMRAGIEQEKQKQQTQINTYFYHCDHLGTPIALTDRQGQIVWGAVKRDPWGNTQEEFNPRGINQDIRLPGQYHDKETGLYYNRHRYYDPRIGSYINQDPIGLWGGGNLYGYPLDPLRGIDALGLFNAEKCASIKRRIENLEKEIWNKRYPDLRTNPGNLPYKTTPRI
jgi:RHS repeat-associated protein